MFLLVGESKFKIPEGIKTNSKTIQELVVTYPDVDEINYPFSLTYPEKSLDILDKLSLEDKPDKIDDLIFLEVTMLVTFLEYDSEDNIRRMLKLIGSDNLILSDHLHLIRELTPLVLLLVKNLLIYGKETTLNFIRNVYNDLSEKEAVQLLLKNVGLEIHLSVDDLFLTFPHVVNKTGKRIYADVLETEFIDRPHKWITQNYYLDRIGDLRTFGGHILSSGPYTKLFESKGWVLVQKKNNIMILDLYHLVRWCKDTDWSVLAFVVATGHVYLLTESNSTEFVSAPINGVKDLIFEPWGHSPSGKIKYLKIDNNIVTKISQDYEGDQIHYHRMDLNCSRFISDDKRSGKINELDLFYQLALPHIPRNFITNMIKKGYEPVNYSGQLISFTDGKVYRPFTVENITVTYLDPKFIDNEHWIFIHQ